MSLLSGARKGNVVEMRWEDIQLDEGIWRIPKTKNDDPQNVTLAPEAIEILKSREDNESDWVFPGTGKTGHLVEPKSGWKRVLDRDEINQLQARIQAAGGEFDWPRPLAKPANHKGRINERVEDALIRARKVAADMELDTNGARRLGVRVLSGLQGNITIPRQTGSMTSGWVAENGALGSSDLTFDNVTMAPKHAGGITEMSRQLIQQSSPDIEQLIRDDLSFILAQAIDSALIKGGGTNEPTGVLSTSGIQTASLSTLSWANVLTMLQKLDLVNASAANIVASTKVKAKLQGTLKAAGIAGYLMENGQVADLPAYFSNQVAEKTGTPNTGRIIAGDWSQVMLGIWSEIDLLVNPFDSTAYARGGVLVRAMATCDIAVRHPNAFVIADDVAI